MSDLISRVEALTAMDTWDKFGCNPDGELVRSDDDSRYVLYVRYDDMVYAIRHLPPAQPTLCGYDIEHLELIASVLRKEGLPPDRVAEALTDIGRIVARVRDEFEEELRKQLTHLPSAQPEITLPGLRMVEPHAGRIRR